MEMKSSRKILGDSYRLLDDIGESSDATTQLAEHVETSKRVVVKSISIRHAETWKALELFEREAEVLEEVDHPRVPDYIDSYHLDGEVLQCVLIQEYVDGETLEDQLAALDGLPVFTEQLQAKEFLISMLEILEYLHGLNPPVVHRDIKPGNIIQRPDGQYLLVDFGTVQSKIPQTMTGSTFVGTTGYMAPEQLAGKASPASDLFSLGATAIQLLSGVQPGQLPVRDMKLQFRSVVDVSDEFADVLETFVEPAEEHRFSSASEAMAALERLDASGVKLPSVDDLEKPSDTDLDIQDGPKELVIDFPIVTRQPAYTMFLIAIVMGIVGWVEFGMVFTSIALFLAALLGAVAFEKPRLRVGPDNFRIEFRRLLSAETFEGTSRHLECQVKPVEVREGLNKKNEKLLLVSHGLNDFVFGKKLLGYVDTPELEYANACIEKFLADHSRRELMEKGPDGDD